jgi:glycosyltransferase involved in cell wall biosynthesis
MAAPFVNVFIVTYNSAAHIERCIDSVLNQADVLLDITVLDNQSADNTVQVLARYGDQIHCILNPENVGFGRAHNQIARQLYSSAKSIYSQQLDFRLGAEPRTEGVYTKYMTEVSGEGNNAENSSAKSIT